MTALAEDIETRAWESGRGWFTPPTEVFAAFIDPSMGKETLRMQNEVEKSQTENFGNAQLPIHEGAEGTPSTATVSGISVIGGKGQPCHLAVYFSTQDRSATSFLKLAHQDQSIILIEPPFHSDSKPSTSETYFTKMSHHGKDQLYQYSLTDSALEGLGFRGGPREFLKKLGLPEALKVQVLQAVERAWAAGQAQG